MWIPVRRDYAMALIVPPQNIRAAFICL